MSEFALGPEALSAWYKSFLDESGKDPFSMRMVGFYETGKRDEFLAGVKQIIEKRRAKGDDDLMPKNQDKEKDVELKRMKNRQRQLKKDIRTVLEDLVSGTFTIGGVVWHRRVNDALLLVASLEKVSKERVAYTKANGYVDADKSEEAQARRIRVFRNMLTSKVHGRSRYVHHRSHWYKMTFQKFIREL